MAGVDLDASVLRVQGGAPVGFLREGWPGRLAVLADVSLHPRQQRVVVCTAELVVMVDVRSDGSDDELELAGVPTP